MLTTTMCGTILNMLATGASTNWIISVLTKKSFSSTFGRCCHCLWKTRRCGKSIDLPMNIKEAFHITLTKLWQAQDAQTAIAHLWTFYSKFSSQDQDGYYKQQCLRWTGLLLTEKGQYTTALAVYNNLLQEVGDDNSSRLEILERRAMTLWKLKRGEQALTDIDTILTANGQEHCFNKLNALSLYVTIIDAMKQPFAAIYKPIIDEVAGFLGMEKPDKNTEDEQTVVRYLVEENQKANREISGILTADSNATAMLAQLRHFGQNTSVGYYQSLAEEQIRQLKLSGQ